MAALRHTHAGSQPGSDRPHFPADSHGRTRTRPRRLAGPSREASPSIRQRSGRRCVDSNPDSNPATMPLAGDGRSGPDPAVDRPSWTLQQPGLGYGSEGKYSSEVQQRPHYLTSAASSRCVPANVNGGTNGSCAEFGTKRSQVQILSPRQRLFLADQSKQV